MLRKFACWFIVFGLSFLAENFGWATQGNAFLFMHLGWTVFVLLVVLLVCLFAGDGIAEKLGLYFLVFFAGAFILGVVLFATWGATKLFSVEFTIAYQIMTFGQCLVTNSKDDNN